MYFVTEWTTRSAPSASGLHRYGEANVLSTTTGTPRSWAASAMAAMSAISVVGLAMVSSHTSRVFGPMASITAAVSPERHLAVGDAEARHDPVEEAHRARRRPRPG